MESSMSSNPDQRSARFPDSLIHQEAYASGISWAAVIAGAFVTAALWLILLALGSGIGLSSVSPWSNAGASAATVGAAAIFWMIVVQFIASSTGGYLAGRLRTKWATIHTDEVYFRDTAHGFLAWAVSLVATAAFLASAATALVSGSVESRAPASPARASNAANASSGALDSSEYYLDTLFRSDHPNPDRISVPTLNEARLVYYHALRQKNLPAADRTYLGRLVTSRTGLSQPEAEGRVSQVFTQLQQEMNANRRALARVFLWLFVAMLIGAFCASYAATIGGRERDNVRMV